MNHSSPSRGRAAAFFDLDGTLLPHPSLEKRFFRELRYRGKIPAKNYFLWLAEAAKLAPRGIAAVIHTNKMYLRGVAVERGARSIVALRSTGDRYPFFPAAIERVAWHARCGHAIYIVSGTLEPLAEQAARALERELSRQGMDLRVQVCATRLEEKDGCWTGRIVGEAMFGKAKTRAAQRIARERGFDLAHCHAYGDNSQDRWILSAVGNPAVVNPSARLARIAKRRGWPQLQWREERRPRIRKVVARSGVVA